MKINKLIFKVFLSVIVAIFAAIGLVASTYTWFELATQNRLSNLNLEVSTNMKYELSLDGIHFNEKITKNNIENVIGKNLKLSNVTTIDNKVFYKTHDEKEIALINKDYISFTLWFRTNSRSEDHIYLVENVSNQYNYEVLQKYEIEGTFCFSKGVTWTNDIPFDNGGDQLVDKNTKNVYYASKAVRIGIIEQNVDEKFLSLKDERSTLDNLIFDPSEDEDRGYGKEFGAFSYYNLKSGTKIELPTVTPYTVTKLSRFKNPYEALDNNSRIASFQKGNDGYFYAKVQINIWLEGWDADCFNSILNDKIAVQLKFRGANPAL